MRYGIITILLGFLSINLTAQHSFIENKNQYPEQVEFKCRLSYGALFLEKDQLVYNFADKSQHEHSHAHHGEGEVHTLHNEIPEKLDFHSYRVKFINSSDDVSLTGKEKQKDYENYFLGKNPDNWATRVGKYRKVKYNKLFSGIDLMFYDKGKGLKYDFIVHPFANTDNIKLEFDGADSLYIENGNLNIKTSVTEVKEIEPRAYQNIAGDKVPVSCEYNLDGNILSYSFPEGYNEAFKLIIDPSLVFSTYTGSTADNWGFTATWDYDDNVFSGGIVFDVGYPVSNGAYQTGMAGGVAPLPSQPAYYSMGCDIGIIKYSPDGNNRIYATYLGGGIAEEMPHSLVVNQKNELVIFGTTGSSDFPVTANAWDTSYNGGDSIIYDNVIVFPDGTDIFISKLSKDGTQLLGSTFLGGSKNDGLNFKEAYTQQGYIQMHGSDSLYYNYGDGARGEVVVDEVGNIYVGANTFSNDINPGLNSGFQSNNGGRMDGLTAKFSSNLSTMLWRSYIGGSKDDAIYSIYPDKNYDVLVCGGTCSADFPVTSQAYKSNYQGGATDGFVAKIKNNGSQVINSTFYGSSAYDQSHFVRIDNKNDVYIYGQTEASGSTLITNAVYSVPNSGQFVSKLNTDLDSLKWSTVVGRGAGEPVLSPSAFAVDVCNRIYLSGWGRIWPNHYINAADDFYTWNDNYGTKGLPVTANAIQTSTDGQDFYVMVLSENATSLEYASFFGEQNYNGCAYSGHDHVDGGTSRFDNKGNIIQSVCASCGGCQQFPTYPVPGVWADTNQSTNCNNAVFKINIIENLAASNFDPIPEICVPASVTFTNNSQGDSYLWDFGDGSPVSNAYEPTHTYTQSGTYEVMLVAYDSLSCNYSDTSYRIINVEKPESTTLPDTTVCPDEIVNIGPADSYDPGTTFQWIQGDNISNPSVKNPDVSTPDSSNYVLIVDDVCHDTVYQTVKTYDIDISVNTPADTMICQGDPVTLNAQLGGSVDHVKWSDNPSFSPVISNSETMTDIPSGNTTYYVQVSEDFCNTTASENVQVLWHQFNYSKTPTTPICENDSSLISITNQNPSDNLSFQWNPVSEIVSGENSSSPLVAPDNNTVFNVTVTNQMGCETNDSVEIIIDIPKITNPVLDEPLCYGDCTGSIDISANGYPPYDYNWNNAQTGSMIDSLCAGPYSVTVTDDIGCTADSSFNINQPDPITAYFQSVTQPVCDGVGLGSAEVYAEGGVGNFNYQWSDGVTGALNDQLHTGNTTVTVTDANGCDTSITVEMIPPNSLQTSVQDKENNPCFGDCKGKVTVNVTGQSPPYTYTWSNNDTGKTITNLCAGYYEVTVVDADNCVIHENITISQPPELSSDIRVTQPILCHGDTTDIKAVASGGTMPYQFIWGNGSDKEILNNKTAGSYSITVTDDHNCKDSINVTITEPDKLRYNGEIKNMICEGVCNGSIRVNPGGGTPPYEYNWQPVEGDSVITDLCSGNYELTMQDKNACNLTAEFTVYSDNYVPPLEISASENTIFKGLSTTLVATDNNYSYNWKPENKLGDKDQPIVKVMPEKTTTYELSITDSMGCRNSDSVKVIVKEIKCGEPYLYVPNAFTPNGDGKNDYFKPHAPPGVITDMYFAVYDRWGEKVYESENINDQGWDGTFRGKELPPDVYVYFFEAKCLNQLHFEEEGNVTLIR